MPSIRWDKAYALIFDVDARHDTKLMQQKEDLRFLISKRILEILRFAQHCGHRRLR
jgi:hypothetical protein